MLCGSAWRHSDRRSVECILGSGFECSRCRSWRQSQALLLHVVWSAASVTCCPRLRRQTIQDRMDTNDSDSSTHVNEMSLISTSSYDHLLNSFIDPISADTSFGRMAYVGAATSTSPLSEDMVGLRFCLTESTKVVVTEVEAIERLCLCDLYLGYHTRARLRFAHTGIIWR